MQFKFNDKVHTYEVSNFNENLESVRTFIKETGLFDLVIQTEEDKKLVKKSRTAIRKKLEEVKSLRIEANKAVLNVFNEQCKQIETLLSNADLELKEKIDNYEKKSTTQTYTLTIKSSNKEVLEKILKEAESQGLMGGIR